MEPSTSLLPLLPLLAWVLAQPVQEAASPGEPPSRSLSRELTASARLAGTVGGERAARFVAARLAEAGFEVELDRRVVLLSHPRRVHVSLRVDGVERFARTDVFDPRRVPPGDVPLYSAWSASGWTEAGVVDAGRGLADDYARLRAAGVDVGGRIVLARYGGAYRGVKAELAQAHGAAGILLFSDPADDGAERGPTWPQGPWKPGWAAQRGSISALTHAPGDPSTPGWASPAPGEAAERLDDEALSARLPRILCTPIGADEARAILEAGDAARVRLELDVPRELFGIVNVIGRLRGVSDDFVVAGNHRDAWVRGAHDAGSGTVTLLRAAQHLGLRTRRGWRPRAGVVLAFWDAEELGLIGSTEWGEAHAAELAAHGLGYVNCDSTVSGLDFRGSGTAGWGTALEAALRRVPDPARPGGDLWAAWTGDDGAPPELGLLGSGSDFAVFLHHLGLPSLNVSFGGNGGGHYHTSFDDFLQMDRHLDPTWQGHETAGLFVAELLGELAERGRAGFDAALEAERIARAVRRAGEEAWLGPERAERLAGALEELAAAARERGAPAPSFLLQALAEPEGLVGRPWFRNPFWAPGLDSGYAAETLPDLRLAAREGEAALDGALSALLARIEHHRGELAAGGRASGGR